MAFSTSSYMRKRLPQPKARIETFALVRPSMRLGSEAIVGWASTTWGKSEMPTPAVVRPTRSRNFLRDKSFIMGTSPARENDCSAEQRKRRGSPGAVRQCGRGTAAQVRHAAGKSDSISDGFPQDPVSLAPLRIHQDYLPPRVSAKSRPIRRMVGRGGGDRNDKDLNKVCVLNVLQPPPLVNRNKRNKASTLAHVRRLGLGEESGLASNCNQDQKLRTFFSGSS